MTNICDASVTVLKFHFRQESKNGAENREWWEISIDGNKMNWSALREDEDGKTFTATFEMTKVQ